MVGGKKMLEVVNGKIVLAMRRWSWRRNMDGGGRRGDGLGNERWTVAVDGEMVSATKR